MSFEGSWPPVPHLGNARGPMRGHFPCRLLRCVIKKLLLMSNRITPVSSSVIWRIDWALPCPRLSPGPVRPGLGVPGVGAWAQAEEVLGQEGLGDVLWLLAPPSGYGLDPSCSPSLPPCLLLSGPNVFFLLPLPSPSTLAQSLPLSGCLSSCAGSHSPFPCLLLSFLAPFSLSFLCQGSSPATPSPAAGPRWLLPQLPPPPLLDPFPGFSLPPRSQTPGEGSLPS